MKYGQFVFHQLIYRPGKRYNRIDKIKQVMLDDLSRSWFHDGLTKLTRVIDPCKENVQKQPSYSLPIECNDLNIVTDCFNFYIFCYSCEILFH